MEKLSNILDKITNKVSYVAMWTTFFLMSMTAIHVILRKVSYLSIPGAMEMTELSLVIIIFCSLGYIQSIKSHIRVDMLVNMFPMRAKKIVECIILFVSAITLFLMFYGGILWVQRQLERGQKTYMLMLPLWPFAIAVAVGLFLYALSITVSAINTLKIATDKENSKAE